VRTSSSRPSFLSASRVATPVLVASAVALVVTLAASCGGGGGQSNPPLPNVVITALHQFVDVGERYFLDGTQTTDPNNEGGSVDDLEFSWRLISGGDENTKFDDHCQDDYDQICDENADDHCSNDTDRICNADSDCEDFGTCDLNSGTSSPDCDTGICGLEEGAILSKASFLANVAGPFDVRLSVVGSDSAGAKNMIVDTYPSLYVVGSIVQFGGTEGALVGPVADADVFAAGASEGTPNPATGDLVIIDDNVGVLRVFDLRTGKIKGSFGESDRFVNEPAALTFSNADGRLYVAQKNGKVLMFDGATGLLVGEFGNVGPNPEAMRFSPTTGNLLVVASVPGSGVKAFASNGTPLGVLGDTDTDVIEPVDIDFVGENSDLLIADRIGRVVRCDGDGTDCGQFAVEADNLLPLGSPSAIVVNPSAEYTENDVMIADPVNGRVIACDSDGVDCSIFGDTEELDSEFKDIFFAPSAAPTTTTSTSTTTTTTLN
jgi:hypothetical protein